MTGRVVVGLIILWPAILWVIAFGIAILAGLNGCEISAQGPSPCVVFSSDFGDSLYPLWALGYYLLGVVFWIVPASIVWLIVKAVAARW